MGKSDARRSDFVGHALRDVGVTQSVTYESSTLSFTQQQIDDPTSPDVRSIAAAVKQDICVRAAGFLQRIGEDRHAVEGAVGVDGRRDVDDGGGEQTLINSPLAMRDAKYAIEKAHLNCSADTFPRVP